MYKKVFIFVYARVCVLVLLEKRATFIEKIAHCGDASLSPQNVI